MKITACIVNDDIGEFEASITIVSRCGVCGGTLSAQDPDSEYGASAWTETQKLIVLPMECSQCQEAYTIHLEIKGD